MLYWYPYEGPLMPIYGAIFKDLMKKGHKVTIVTSFPHFRNGRPEIWQEYRARLYEITEWEGIKLIRCYVYAPSHSQRSSGLFYRVLNFISFNITSPLAAILLTGKADVVFAPSSPPLSNGIVAWFVSLFKRCPMVYNVQDLYPDMAIKLNLVQNHFVVAVLLGTEKLVYRLSKKILTISESMAGIITKKGVSPEKIKVIENFIDTDFIRPGQRNNAFSRANCLNGSFVVMYAGNIGIPHGVEVLVLAAEILRKEKGIIFCFVGRGEYKEKMKALTKDKDLNNVVFIEPQPENVVPMIWASASVGGITYRKGLAEFSVPSKLLAMMSAARPVIASVDSDSSTAKLIKKAECGIIVSPESAEALAESVMQLKERPDLAEKMGNNGRFYLENKFTRGKIVTRYESFFRRVVASDHVVDHQTEL